MNSDIHATWERLRQITNSVREVADNITVVFVANRQCALSGDPEDRSTEYFTDYEATQILAGFRASGFRTLYFEGENEFISYVLAKEGLICNSKWTIVYNTAQSGTDPGRKSMIPSFCALQGIPTCNSNSYAVSLARHKMHVHAILRKYGIPTPDTWAFDAYRGWLCDERPPAHIKLIAKAGHESASIGLDDRSVGTLSENFENVLREKSKGLKQLFVVQSFITGSEFELPVTNSAQAYEPLIPVSITVGSTNVLGDKILSFNTVASDEYGFTTCPIEYQREATRMRKVATAVCEVLGLDGFARVDFRMDNDRNIWVTDVSTSPHIVMHSSFWYIFEQAGWSYSNMLACMIAVNAAKYGWIPQSSF